MKIFNKQLNPKIIDELEYLDAKYFMFDKPIPFKEGLTLYPAKMTDYDEFMACSSCLQINKNDDIEGVIMTHLDYLYKLMQDKASGSLIKQKFSRLIEIIFHIENGVRCDECGTIMSYHDYLSSITTGVDVKCSNCGGNMFKGVIHFEVNPQTKQKILMINGVEITNFDYERLRQIVMYQNFPDYKDDSWVNPEIREDQELRARLTGQQSNKHLSATVEKKIVCVSSQTNYSIEELYDFTIRKFIMLLTAVDDAIEYQITKLAAMTGLVKIDNIEHWIYKPDATLYKEAVDAESYEKKVQSANG